MNIIYPGKIMANIHVSWLDPRRVRSMTVVGSKKMVVYDDIAENKIAIYDKGIDRIAILGKIWIMIIPFFKTFVSVPEMVYYLKLIFKNLLRSKSTILSIVLMNGAGCITGIDHAKKVVEILSSSE